MSIRSQLVPSATQRVFSFCSRRNWCSFHWLDEYFHAVAVSKMRMSTHCLTKENSLSPIAISDVRAPKINLKLSGKVIAIYLFFNLKPTSHKLKRSIFRTKKSIPPISLPSCYYSFYKNFSPCVRRWWWWFGMAKKTGNVTPADSKAVLKIVEGWRERS